MPSSIEYRQILKELDQLITGYESQYITNRCIPTKFKKELVQHLKSLYSDDLNENTSTQGITFWRSPNFDKECLRLYHNLLTAKALNRTHEKSGWSKDDAAFEHVLSNMIITLSRHVTQSDENLVQLMLKCNTDNCSLTTEGLCIDGVPYQPHWYSCVKSIGRRTMERHFENSVNSIAQEIQSSNQLKLMYGN